MKILLWLVADDFRSFQGAITALGIQHGGLEIVGVTADETLRPHNFRINNQSVPFVPLDEVCAREFDVVLVVGAKELGMSEVVKLARQLNLPEEKLLCDCIVCVPGFTLEKYRSLQRSRLSIFAMHCFGGLISNLLGLQFRSPTVNMFFREEDFIKFLRAPRAYLDENLTFKETRFDEGTELDYPVCMLGDVEIHMNHYRDFDEAVEFWNRRKARINPYNLFVVMHTESEDTAREFDALPFGKKVCFVPFESDLPSAWYINPETKPGEPLWRLVNLFAYGDPFYFDVFDMLLYGKKTPLET